MTTANLHAEWPQQAHSAAHKSLPYMTLLSVMQDQSQASVEPVIGQPQTRLAISIQHWESNQH